MTTTVRILGISGSLRKQSYNTALLRAAQQCQTEAYTLAAATLQGIPLYDGDLEQAEGIPAAVNTLKEQILACDGLLLVTPEYNNGIPGVFKNAIDWLSRVPATTPALLAGRPVAIIGASPGGFGTVSSQAMWLPVLKSLGMLTWSEGRLLVSRAHKAFDAQGKLLDDNVSQQLQEFLQRYVKFVGRHGQA